MAVLVLHITSSSDVGVKDLLIHRAAYYSCSSAGGSIYILSPQHNDAVSWKLCIFLVHLKGTNKRQCVSTSVFCEAVIPCKNSLTLFYIYRHIAACTWPGRGSKLTCFRGIFGAMHLPRGCFHTPKHQLSERWNKEAGIKWYTHQERVCLYMFLLWHSCSGCWRGKFYEAFLMPMFKFRWI